MKEVGGCRWMRDNVNGFVNLEGHLYNIKNQARRLCRPLSIHLYHQKPNPARETLPLTKG
jgi:hypothetical protein